MLNATIQIFHKVHKEPEPKSLCFAHTLDWREKIYLEKMVEGLINHKSTPTQTLEVSYKNDQECIRELRKLKKLVESEGNCMKVCFNQK